MTQGVPSADKQGQVSQSALKRGEIASQRGRVTPGAASAQTPKESAMVGGSKTNRIQVETVGRADGQKKTTELASDEHS